MQSEHWPTITNVVAALNLVKSPSTRTHIHKLMFFAQEFNELPPGYKFVLHHHGPYSFDLDRDIIDMEAFGAIRVIKDPAGFGARYEADAADVGEGLQRLAAWLGPMSTRQLEAVATTEFMLKDRSKADAVAAVLSAKPHLRDDEVRTAMSELQKMQESK